MIWTEEQTNFLLDNYGKLKSIHIAKILGRSRTSVAAKVSKMGLCTQKRPSNINQKSPGQVTFNFVLNRYKTGAKRRNYEFNLTNEEFSSVISMNCHYCNAEPRNYSVYEVKDQWVSQKARERSYIKYNGIDRIDSKLGYINSNIVPCCYKCNIAKSDMSYNEFKSWLLNVFNNFLRKENKND